MVIVVTFLLFIWSCNFLNQRTDSETFSKTSPVPDKKSFKLVALMFGVNFDTNDLAFFMVDRLGADLASDDSAMTMRTIMMFMNTKADVDNLDILI